MGDSLKSKNILVVDDEEDAARSMESILTRGGYVAEIAVSGEEALAKAKEKDFDLVFLDIHLPRMSGLEIFRQLREIIPQARICIVTGWPKGLEAQKGEYLDLIREGAIDQMLRKPFSREEVLATAKNLLERS